MRLDPEGSLVLSCKFEYGTTVAYGASVPCAPDPGFENDPVSVSADISGLQPNTDYHYRVVVTNEGGTTNGDDVELTTLIDKPVVTTGGSSGVNSSSATLTGQVNPLSNPVTSCRFEYGADSSYGSIAPCGTDPGSGGARCPSRRRSPTSRRAPHTTTDWWPESTEGLESGSDASFTTLPQTPTVATGAATICFPTEPNCSGK